MSSHRLASWLAPLLLLCNANASASVVERGYLPLADGTLLNYTLTRPSAEGRFPTVLQYDPYAAGVTSDPTWNDSGYAMLGVNVRGTGCSQGTFHVTRADEWGPDGAEVVAWAANQSWSDGSFGMIGFSFTGTTQLAVAAFAGEHLKAIAPGNVFPDIYRDITYPGGVFNQWLPAWILAGRAVVGNATFNNAAMEPECAQSVLRSLEPNVVQTPDIAIHDALDDYWSTQPSVFLDRVKIPVLGCVNWQDTTVYSRSANMFRDQLPSATTWMVGSNGAHTDCPISRARYVRFFDRYLKRQDNGWESTPHVLLMHELAGPVVARESRDDNAGAWQSSYQNWNDLAAAITPITLHLHSGGGLNLTPPESVAAETYSYPLTSTNTPADWTGTNRWGDPAVPGGALSYTTPALTQDAEFMGSGSVNLWLASTASDADVQVTLSEVRPDGQEMFVQNGWLRLSHRKLDPQKSTVLRPLHTDLPADVEPLASGEPVLARIEMQPFNHVFRAGSALRLNVDAPGTWMAPAAAPATNTLYTGPQQGSELVLGWVPAGRGQTGLPACGSVLNQPCRANATAVPPGALTISDGATATPTSPIGADQGHFGGATSLLTLCGLLLAGCGRRRFS